MIGSCRRTGRWPSQGGGIVAFGKLMLNGVEFDTDDFADETGAERLARRLVGETDTLERVTVVVYGERRTMTVVPSLVWSVAAWVVPTAHVIVS